MPNDGVKQAVVIQITQKNAFFLEVCMSCWFMQKKNRSSHQKAPRHCIPFCVFFADDSKLLINFSLSFIINEIFLGGKVQSMKHIKCWQPRKCV